MSDQTDQNLTIQQPPPSGDPKRAEKYINQLIDFISKDKVEVTKTDLSQFDPSSMEDHYRIDLKDYQVEVSHNKQPNTGKDSYIILFTNLKNVHQDNCEKIILAYMHLEQEQFSQFKETANIQIEKRRKEAEEKRLKEAMEPIDQLLDNLESNESLETKHEVKEDSKENNDQEVINKDRDNSSEQENINSFSSSL